MRKILSIILVLTLVSGAAWATTSFTRLKTWTAEKLYAADLNSEFDNVGTYLNNNIAWVTNITASATDLNQLDNNRFINASEFISAIEDSANVTMNTGFVYTNHGKAVFDSLAADSLYATAQGPTKIQFGAGFVPDTTVGKGRYLGKPTGRFEVWADTANVSVLVPAKIDTSAAFVIGRANIQTNAIDSQLVISIGSDDIPKTISLPHIWTGTQFFSVRDTFAAGLVAQDSFIVTSGTLRSGTSKFWQTGNNTYVGTVALNANMTGPGVTINQGGSDDEIISLKSTDVAHGMTGVSETNTYGLLLKDSAVNGGLHVQGINGNGYVGIHLVATATNDTNATSTGALGYLNVQVRKKSGTSTAQPAATANLMVIRAEGSTEFIFDGDGTGKADDVWTDTAFDLAEEYDVVLPDTTQTPSYMRAQFRKLIHGFTTTDKTTGQPIYAKPDTVKFQAFSIEGCVVTVDAKTDNKFALTTAPYQVVTGVVSYHTAQLADPLEGIRDKYPQLQLGKYANPTPVGIVGLIPTKICNEGGVVNRGDLLVSSSKQGVAMKGNPLLLGGNPRKVVGIALMPFSALNPDSVGVINVQR